MRTQEELEYFYNYRIKNDLEELEKLRKITLVKFSVVALFAILSLLAYIWYITNLEVSTRSTFFLLAVIFLVLFAVSTISSKYQEAFKNDILKTLVQYVDTNLQYTGKEGNGKFYEHFSYSSLFTVEPNEMNIEDCVSGYIDNVGTEFCEMKAVKVSGSGKYRTSTTIFKGLFFAFDTNKNFDGKVVILPKSAEKLQMFFRKFIKATISSRKELVVLEDLEFDKNFNVFSDDQIKARYILNLNIINRIMDFRNNVKRNIYLSFIDSKLYIAIPFRKNLFEPRYFRSIVDFRLIKEFYEYLKIGFDIVEQLQLDNTI